MATRQETNKSQEQHSKPAESKPGDTKSMEQGKSHKQSQPSRQSERGLAPSQRGGSLASSGGGWEPLSRLFDQFSRSWLGLASPGWEGGWGLDVREEDGSVIVRAEAPGFEPSDFDIQVRGDRLVLSASHRSESKGNEGGYQEWRRQEFYRSVTLPSAIDRDKVKAAYRQGILTVTLPQSEQGNGKRINVEG
jgi:HSP20 family protein